MVIRIIWTQGKNFLRKFGLSLRWSQHRIRNGNRRVSERFKVEGHTRYQEYTGSSDWSRIRMRFNSLKITKFDCKLRIEHIKTPEAQMEDIYAINFSGLEANRLPKYSIFYFFVKEEYLQKQEQLQFNIILCPTKEGLSRTETRGISINTSKKTQILYVSLGFQKDDDLPIEVEISREPDIKFRNTPQLCDREEEFVTKRRAAILEHMRTNLGLINLQQKNAPNIAVIGSGGGMRAVIGMCGAMTALKEKGILDATMYTSGLSGSAWYLLSLFANDKQHNPEDLTNFLRRKLQTISLLQFMELAFAWRVAKRAIKRNTIIPIDFTLTHYFGFMIGRLLNDKQEDAFWSKQTDKLENGSVPLPLIAALHVRDARRILEYHEWIEISPYEVFIPKYGAAIDMKKFGNEMFGGYSVDDKESTIAFLQGMCGGGYAVIKDWAFLFIIGFNIADLILVGAIPNILYRITGLSQHAENPGQHDLQNDSVDIFERNMMLADAGLSINSPYPTVLHPSRKVDVIVSLDFSDRVEDKGWPFEELEFAAKWAERKNLPFPKLYPKLTEVRKEWENGQYEEVYIFPGDNSPTIVHFVMINKSFREIGGDRHDFDILPHYKTLKFHYLEREFDKFHSLIEHNVLKNSDKILDCIRDAIDRKQKETDSCE